MPFRPDLVLGGLRWRAATLFTDWVIEWPARCRGRRSDFGVIRPAEALMASVIEGAAGSMLLSVGLAAVARPEGLVERADLFGCRAMSLRLRDAAAGLQTQGERRQIAQLLGQHCQLETACGTQAVLDRGLLVPAGWQRVENDDRPVARFAQIDEIKGV